MVYKIPIIIKHNTTKWNLVEHYEKITFNIDITFVLKIKSSNHIRQVYRVFHNKLTYEITFVIPIQYF